jgi:GNAT superfamily N-acetyltransferase
MATDPQKRRKERDAEFLQAVASGDTTVQTKLVDEAANESLAGMRDRWKASGVNLWMNAREGDITLSEIVVPKEDRGQGKGTAAMTDLLTFAQEHRMRVLLTPGDDFGATSVARLKRFYGGLGFSANKGRNRDFRTRETMIWRPTDYEKHVDPVVRDAAGEVVPLSARFGLALSPGVKAGTEAPDISHSDTDQKRADQKIARKVRDEVTRSLNGPGM